MASPNQTVATERRGGLGRTQRVAAMARRLAARLNRRSEAPTATAFPIAGSANDQRGSVFELGFHGDAHLLSLVDRLMPEVHAYVETGANLGSTTRYVAERFAPLSVYACEMDPEAAKQARQHLAGLPNAELACEGSPAFVHRLHDERPDLRSTLNFYFFDAHGHGFEWPLAGELAFVSSLERGIVLVDDCRVPGRPQFKYSKYAGIACDLAYAERALAGGRSYDVVVPDYQDRTSPHHPLTGYALIAFGTPLLREAVADDPRFKYLSLSASAQAAA